MGEIIQFKKREIVSPKVKPFANGFNRIIRGRTTGYKFYQAEIMEEIIIPSLGSCEGYVSDRLEYVAPTPYIQRPYREDETIGTRIAINKNLEAIIERVAINGSGQPIYPEPEEYKGEHTPEFQQKLSVTKQMMNLASLPLISDNQNTNHHILTVNEEEGYKRIALAKPNPCFTYIETMDPNTDKAFYDLAKSVEGYFKPEDEWDEVTWDQSIEGPVGHIAYEFRAANFDKARRVKNRRKNKLAKKARRK